jgi:hypothetical protein
MTTKENLGQKLCKALGIDSARVYAIEIRVAAQDTARVTVSRYETDETLDGALEALSHYELVEIEEDET